MTSKAHSLHLSAYYHQDAPAFHAGIIVLILLGALLGNFGIFFLFIAAHAGLDVVKYREVQKLSWKKTAQAVLRESMLDIAVFSVGLALWLMLHPDAGYLAQSGMERSIGTLIRGVGTLAAKTIILVRILPALVHPRSYLHFRTFNAKRGQSFAETLCLAACVFAFLLLALVGVRFQGGIVGMLHALSVQLHPWRF